MSALAGKVVPVDTAWDEVLTFYHAVRPRLVVNLFHLLQSRQDAEDVAQDAFIQAAQKWHTLRAKDAASVTAWLNKIAVNLARTRMKQRGRRREVIMSDYASVSQLVSTYLSPERAYEVSAAYQVLRVLSDRQREVYLLRHYFGASKPGHRRGNRAAARHSEGPIVQCAEKDNSRAGSTRRALKTRNRTDLGGEARMKMNREDADQHVVPEPLHALNRTLEAMFRDPDRERAELAAIRAALTDDAGTTDASTVIPITLSGCRPARRESVSWVVGRWSAHARPSPPSWQGCPAPARRRHWDNQTRSAGDG